MSPLLAVLLPALVLAGNLDIAAPPQNPTIWGGDETESCAWPSVVTVTSQGSLCSGTLIHPKVVLYAAHCGDDDKTIRFGDGTDVSQTVAIEYCKANPYYFEHGSLTQFDWAYCVLQDEVTAIPFTPVGYGCEVEQYLQVDREIAIVGFGDDLGERGAGRKRWGFSTVFSMADDYAFNVLGQSTNCSGDSGGPAFVRYPDGSWHTFGIASAKWDDTCSDAAGRYSVAPNAAKWIEEDSGIDVTVCHDIDGNWDPSHLCGGFFDGEAELGYGSWSTWCEDVTASGWSDSCGADFGSEVESDAPELEIVAPGDGESFVEDPSVLDIEIAVADASGFWEVYVEIMSTGGDVVSSPVITNANPTVFTAEFFTGEYTLVAHATDFWGNQAISMPVSFTVGEPSEESGSSDGGDESTDSADDDLQAEPDVDGGCSCRAGDRARDAGWALLVGLALLGLRRRSNGARTRGLRAD